MTYLADTETLFEELKAALGRSKNAGEITCLVPIDALTDILTFAEDGYYAQDELDGNQRTINDLEVENEALRADIQSTRDLLKEALAALEGDHE